MSGLKYQFIGIDNNNHIYWIKKHPRKELLEQLAPYSKSSVNLMYHDASNGKPIGYVIGQGHGYESNWIQVFKINEWKAKENAWIITNTK